MKFFMILLLTCKLYASDDRQITKKEFLYCIALFKECHLEETEAYKNLIARNQSVYDKYMKKKRVTFSGKDEICQL